VQTFDEGLRGETPELAYYDIAAKTGTAQIPNPKGGYYTDRNLHSFFGFFPASDPKALLLLMIENPKNAKYSSETLADPFKSLVQFLIHHYAIPPDRLDSPENTTSEESSE
jgi:cell division protein FtsI/penicillin-binding protein 2